VAAKVGKWPTRRVPYFFGGYSGVFFFSRLKRNRRLGAAEGRRKKKLKLHKKKHKKKRTRNERPVRATRIFTFTPLFCIFIV